MLLFGCAHAPHVPISVPLTLAWSAPSECPDQHAVLRSVAERLGDTAAASDSGARVHASAHVARSGDQYVLELETPHGERQLRAASCTELAQGASLILALVVDPQAATMAASSQDIAPSQPEPPPRPALVEAGPTVPAPAAPPAAQQPAQAAKPALGLGGRVRAELSIDMGVMPNVAVSPGIALGASLPHITLELSTALVLPNDVAYPQRRGVPDRPLAELSGFAGRLGLCGTAFARLELGACLAVEYLQLTADPDLALTRESSASAGVWTLLAAARLTAPIGTRFAWVLELAAGVPVRGTRLTVAGLGVVDETSDVIGRLRTGPELRF
jgi:hypothetical protein